MTCTFAYLGAAAPAFCVHMERRRCFTLYVWITISRKLANHCSRVNVALLWKKPSVSHEREILSKSCSCRECLFRGQFERGYLALAWSKHFLDEHTPPWLCLIWPFSGYLDLVLLGSLLDLAPYNPENLQVPLVWWLVWLNKSACHLDGQTSWIKPIICFECLLLQVNQNRAVHVVTSTCPLLCGSIQR